MVLLTSSSISVLISSSIIFLFTFFLFLSGYVLQQQTVRNLQAALHPAPTPTVSVLRVYPESYTVDGRRAANGTVVDAKAVGGNGMGKGKVEVVFGSPPGSAGHRAYQDALGVTESSVKTIEIAQTDAADLEYERLTDREKWKNLAYVQILEDPSDICSSLLFFRTLVQQQSNIPGRIIIYPSSWSTALALPDASGINAAATALLALRDAEASLNLTLQPINIPSNTNTSNHLTTLIAAPFLLSTYRRLLYVPHGGLLLNTTTLDETLAASPPDDLNFDLGVVGSEDEMASPALLLIRPSQRAWEQIMTEVKRVNSKIENLDLDAMFESLVSGARLDVPRLEMRETETGTETETKTERLRRLVTSTYETVDESSTGATPWDEPSYLHFSRQEAEDGTTMEVRGGMWWNGLVRYRKAIREMCEGLDLGDRERRGWQTGVEREGEWAKDEKGGRQGDGALSMDDDPVR